MVKRQVSDKKVTYLPFVISFVTSVTFTHKKHLAGYCQ